MEVVDALQNREPLAASDPGDVLESVSIVQLASDERDEVALPPEQLLPCPARVGAGGSTGASTVDGPLPIVDLAFDYAAVIRTSLGDIAVDLFTQETPVTVNNFVYLGLCGFYS